MNIGIVYVAWGDKYLSELERSRDSAESFGYKTHVIEPTYKKGHAAKIAMYEQTPFDLTCYLDTDTVVLGELAYGFEMARRHYLACCIAPASNAARWSPAMPDQMRDKFGDYAVEYNTGALFFSKCHAMDRFFRVWKRKAALFPHYDQPTFAVSVMYTGINPYVLPREWNFRAEFGGTSMLHSEGYGPVKIWHSRREPPKDMGKVEGFFNLNVGEVAA